MILTLKIFCRKPCEKTCGLCGGCDLIKSLGLNPAGLANFGVDVKVLKIFNQLVLSRT